MANTPDIVFQGTRILTAAQIQELGTGDFRAYRTKVYAMRELAFRRVSESSDPTPDQVKAIKIFDRLASDVWGDRLRRILAGEWDEK